jgi:ubiquinone/menaquinone biosynthesis C-methylase UbiE
MPGRIERFVESMNVQPRDRVLEIGCGHGIAATLICAKLKGGSYLAIDRSGKMIAAAAKRNDSFVRSGVATFVQASLESLDLDDQEFDKILAMRVRLFHEQAEPARALAERWLAPGGKLFIEYDEPHRRRPAASAV